MPSIGLFGGSFDPIHHGHLIVARVAQETLGLDELRFLPAREQPFKRGRHGASAADLPNLARIVVFGRPGTPVPTSPLIAGTIEVPAVDISATEIRRRAAAGLPVRYWVPDAVAEYMVRHRLYLDPA